MLLSTTNAIITNKNHHTISNKTFNTNGNGMIIAFALENSHIVAKINKASTNIIQEELQYIYATISNGRPLLKSSKHEIVPLPPYYDRVEGAHYSDNNQIFLYQRGSLIPTSRVDIAIIHNNRNIQEIPEAEATTKPTIEHGEIVFDIQGNPITQGDSYLLTTTIRDKHDIQISNELEPLLLETKANQNISKNKIVKIVLLDELKTEIASYHDIDKEILGIALNDAEQGDTLLVAMQCIATFKTKGAVGDRLFIGDGTKKGDIISYNPRELHYKNDKKNSIGKILPNDQIIFGQSNELLEAVFRRQSRFRGLLPALYDRLGIVRVSVDSSDPVAAETTDPRLSDPRLPLPHTHTMADINIPDDFDWGHSGEFDPDEPVDEPDSIMEWIRYLNTTKLDIDDSRLFDSREAKPHTHFAREIDIESFGTNPKSSLQGAIERLQRELIGIEGGIIDGILTINKEPVLSRDAVNLEYIESIRINQLQVVKINKGDIELEPNETSSFTVKFSEAEVYRAGNLLRGMLYYTSIGGNGSATMNILDSSGGMVYSTSNSAGGAEVDREPVTADFGGDIVVQIVNGSEHNNVNVGISYVVLDGNEAVIIEGDEDEISIGAAIEFFDLRDIKRRVSDDDNWAEVVDAKVDVTYLGPPIVDISFDELGLSEDMDVPTAKVVSGEIFDKGELIKLYDEMCTACMAHSIEWGEYCASEEHFLACEEAKFVIDSDDSTLEDLDDAILRLKSSAFVAFFGAGGSGAVEVRNLNAPYTVKFRARGSDTPFDEWDRNGNNFDIPSGVNFPSAAEIFITVDDIEEKSTSTNSSIAIKNSGTLDEVLTWGELGIKRFVLSGNTKNFEVPDWLPLSVNNMANMFEGCINFNSKGVSTWDVSNNTTLYYTFDGAKKFNRNINTWATNKVTTLERTFHGASDFNQPLGNWNIGNVTDLHGTFTNTKFNQDISSWNTAKVERMVYTFSGTPFNKALNSWNVGAATTMSYMFRNCPFNQVLSNWNVGNVTNMSYMFNGSSFNRPLENWDVRKVTNMNYMFGTATNFNQHLAKWNVTNVNISNTFPGFSDATKWRRTRPWFLTGSPTAEIPRTPSIMVVYEEILGNPEQRRKNQGAANVQTGNEKYNLTSKNGISSLNWRKLGSSVKYTVGTSFSIPNTLNSGYYEFSQFYNQNDKIMDYVKYFEYYIWGRGQTITNRGWVRYTINKTPWNYEVEDNWPTKIGGGGGWSLSVKSLRNYFVGGENGIHKIHDDLRGDTIVIHPGGVWKN